MNKLLLALAIITTLAATSAIAKQVEAPQGQVLISSLENNTAPGNITLTNNNSKDVTIRTKKNDPIVILDRHDRIRQSDKSGYYTYVNLEANKKKTLQKDGNGAYFNITSISDSEKKAGVIKRDIYVDNDKQQISFTIQ